MKRLWPSLCLLVAAGCAAGPTVLRPAGGFAHALGRDHPLAGRVYAVGAHELVTPEGLFDALAQSELVLLGETHDNRDHHALQAQLVEQFAESHAHASVAFEMLDESQEPALVRGADTPEQLAKHVEWAESGWPAFELYR